MHEPSETTLHEPGFLTMLLFGLGRTCPRCGEGRLFEGYLKLTDKCGHCGQALGHIRADDFPPYLTMVIVGHIVVPALLLTEKLFAPSIALQLGIWLPVSGLLTYWVLPRVKGAIVGWMLRLGLRGDESQ